MDEFRFEESDPRVYASRSRIGPNGDVIFASIANRIIPPHIARVALLAEPPFSDPSTQLRYERFLESCCAVGSDGQMDSYTSAVMEAIRQHNTLTTAFQTMALHQAKTPVTISAKVPSDVQTAITHSVSDSASNSAPMILPFMTFDEQLNELLRAARSNQVNNQGDVNMDMAE